MTESALLEIDARLEVVFDGSGGVSAEKLRDRLEEAGLGATVLAFALPERDISASDPAVREAGVSYLTALTRIAKLDEAVVPTALLVLLVALIQQLFLELPLLGYALRPEKTERAVAAFRDWLARRGRHAATVGATIIGVLLIVRGTIGLLT